MALSIGLIIVAGLAAGFIFDKMKLPGLIGMLAAGILFGPYVLDFFPPQVMIVSGDFRKIALIVILLRAGFELRKDALKRIGKAAVFMSIIPAVFEMAAVTVVAPIFLGITILEGAILGAILAAVSPAVVVPLMIEFMEKSRGAQKGIPTLILGASSLDDVFVIVIFTVLLGVQTGGGSSWLSSVWAIPVSVFTGIAIGLLMGYLLYRIFIRYDWQPPKRTLLILGVSIFLTWLETRLEGILPMASLLGVMAIGFIILEKSEAIAHLISRKLKHLWVFAELLLFVLVGAQVNIHVAWKSGLAGIAVIFTGLIFRSIGTWVSLTGNNFSSSEKFFCIVAYIPKATVQAAIGAIPLASGVASGEVILAVAVLSIILTAPIGAAAIRFFGEKILDHAITSGYRFKHLREKLEIPRVGERIRNKRSDHVWKVIEESELWQEDDAGQEVIPVIKQRLWKLNDQNRGPKGKTITCSYTYRSSPFSAHWEILYDW